MSFQGPQGQHHGGPFMHQDYNADMFAGGPGIRDRHEDSPFDARNYYPDMFASGPAEGPGVGMAVGVAVGVAALIGGAMYLLGGKPSMPTATSFGRGLGITTSGGSEY